MEYRKAAPLDISALIMLLVSAHQETELEVSPINSEKAISTISDVIHRGVSFVAVTDNNTIAGSIGGGTISDWWSTKPVLSDYWFYVPKEHRNSDIAMQLVKRFIEAGKEAKVSIQLGHILSGDVDRKDHLFERLGFIKAGSTFLEK
jgi:L-amino acid N-acyltransferase YncA